MDLDKLILKMLVFILLLYAYYILPMKKVSFIFLFDFVLGLILEAEEEIDLDIFKAIRV